MKTKEIINELFHSPVPFKWSVFPHDQSQDVSADFTVGDVDYAWFAALGNEPHSWEVEFQDTDRGYGITGRGNAAVVLSTVLDIMDIFIRKTGASQLTFSATEPSRRALYAAIIKRLLPSWKVDRIGSYFRVTSPYRDTDSDY